MALPTADSLLPAVASVQRSLSVFEAGLSGTQIAVGSSDGKVVAIANGLVELVSITIDPGELTQGAGALAAKVLYVCAQALSLANADTAPKAAAKARTFDLSGLPGVNLPPPTDDGFDVTASRV